MLKLPFHPGRVPKFVEKSIYAAAARKGMQVSVHVRAAAVYICNDSPLEIKASAPAQSETRCEVCHAVICIKPGTGKQYVCAGFRKKTECQKILRYSREFGISIEEAKRRWIERARKRHKELK